MSDQSTPDRCLSDGDLHQLKRWNTPTIYNGWEQVTKRNPAREGFNLEETRDFMPQMEPMAGYAVTVVIEPGNKEHRDTHPNAGEEYRRHLAAIPEPKIVVVQDLDKPSVMDENECRTVIPAARNSAGCTAGEALAKMESAIGEFRENVKAKFNDEGEW